MGFAADVAEAALNSTGNDLVSSFHLNILCLTIPCTGQGHRGATESAASSNRTGG